MREADLYQKLEGDKVQCQLCALNCVIEEGDRGQCGVRENRKGKLFALTYKKPISTSVDPIEKKPLFHFRPGSKAYSIATSGCNFKCTFCQNWKISQPDEFSQELTGHELLVEDAVNQAQRQADGIAYTYTEPTIFFEYAYDMAKLAKKKGLYNVFVSNGYMTKHAVEKLSPVLDAINIDLKSMEDEFYQELCGVNSHQPVLDSIKKFKENGVWVEITNLLIPDWNTKPKKIKELTDWIVEHVGKEVPLHFSRFHPDHDLKESQPTSREKIDQAVKIARNSGLKYVYVGNMVHEHNNSFCPECGFEVINRKGYSVSLNLEDGFKCPQCGYELDLAY